MAQPNVTSISELDLAESALSGLSRNNGRIKEGTSDDIRSPLFKGMEDGQILAAWDAVFQTGSDSLRPTLLKMEENNRSKFGPRSIAKPWEERRLSTYAYFRDQGGRSLEPRGERGSLRPLEVARAVKHLIPSTSTGLPFLVKKRQVMDRLNEQSLQALLLRLDPCVLFTRTQEGGKTRDVWGFPIAETLFEQTYFQPLLRLRQRLTIERAALLGPDAVELALFDLLGKAKRSDATVVSIDFSQYDATCQPRLTEPALRTLLSYFQGWDDNRERLIERFTNIGLVTPDGVLSGPHGVPSGSTFTNEVDSQVQMMIAQDSGLSEYMTVQGDDGVHVTHSPSELEDYFESFGVKVNRDKSHKSAFEAIYLQNYFHVDDLVQDRGPIRCKGVYPTYRALNRIVHMERWTDLDQDLSGDDFFAIRTISILENCKRHPMFESLVNFVAQHDRNSLNYSDSGLRAFISKVADKGRAGILHQWSENVKGLASFETVRVLKGL